jgi:hypothetical protein
MAVKNSKFSCIWAAYIFKIVRCWRLISIKFAVFMRLVFFRQYPNGEYEENDALSGT